MWNKSRDNGDNRTAWFVKAELFLGVLLSAGMLSAGVSRMEALCLQRGIREEVLRFHVLADSDSTADQAVKLKVRDGVLDWLKENLSKEEQGDLIRMKERIVELLPDIEKTADQIVKEEGFAYGAKAVLGESRFPVRTYGNCTFPAGNYCALKIILGRGEGHNWWCILFPRLCFTDCVEAVLPEESREELQNVLTEEEYESLFDPAQDSYEIAFRYF